MVNFFSTGFSYRFGPFTVNLFSIAYDMDQFLCCAFGFLHRIFYPFNNILMATSGQHNIANCLCILILYIVFILNVLIKQQNCARDEKNLVQPVFPFQLYVLFASRHAFHKLLMIILPLLVGVVRSIYILTRSAFECGNMNKFIKKYLINAKNGVAKNYAAPWKQKCGE